MSDYRAISTSEYLDISNLMDSLSQTIAEIGSALDHAEEQIQSLLSSRTPGLSEEVRSLELRSLELRERFAERQKEVLRTLVRIARAIDAPSIETARSRIVRIRLSIAENGRDIESEGVYNDGLRFTEKSLDKLLNMYHISLELLIEGTERAIRQKLEQMPAAQASLEATEARAAELLRNYLPSTA
jgi:hypothetical protein